MNNSRIIKRIIVIGEVIIFIGFVGLCAWLLRRVFDGKGADLYQNHWGISFSAIGVLILLAISVLAVIAGVYLTHKHKSEEKSLISKYGKDRDV